MNTMLILLAFAQIDVSNAANVREAIPGERRIIHVRDWHLVSKEDFATDTALTGKELDDAYAEHLEAVRKVQASQRKILAHAKDVYIEGLKPSDKPIFDAIVRLQRKQRDEETMLRIGAAGQLLVDGKLTVNAAEAEDFGKGNPVKDGVVTIDEAAQEAREDAIVKELLKQKKTVVLVLGGAHDLTDNIKRLTKDCGYTVVTPKGYPE